MDRLTEPRAPDPSPALATNAEIVFSASHLNDFLECEHLTQLELAVVRGELARPHVDNDREPPSPCLG